MDRLPVVEGLVAVLDRGEKGGHEVDGQEDVECVDGFDRKRSWSSERDSIMVSIPATLQDEADRWGRSSSHFFLA